MDHYSHRMPLIFDYSNNENKLASAFSDDSNSRDDYDLRQLIIENNQHTQNFLGKRRDLCDDDDDDGKIKRKKQQSSTQPVKQTTDVPAYSYKKEDLSHLGYRRGTLSMMSTCNMTTSMTTPWNINPVDGMNVSMTINQSVSTEPKTDSQEKTINPDINSPVFMTMPKNMFNPTLKRIVYLKNCVLYPPDPNVPWPTTTERPFRCKTVTVCGLPEKATEEIIKEVFEGCGAIESVKMLKNNCCHIKFTRPLSTENAVYFSGYTVKVENKDEAPYTGKIIVVFAQVQDDRSDYDSKHRASKRQARHREQTKYRPKPPRIVHYSDHEASRVCDKLKDKDTFLQAASILITWFERGELTKKNAGSFYSMIQSTHSLVRKLQVDKIKYEERFHADKTRYEERLNDVKKIFKEQMHEIIYQFTEIGKIYKAACLQKCWDQFTKAQRKYIDIWKKQTEELKDAHVEDVVNERQDEAMELSDDDNGDSKKDLGISELKSQPEQDIPKLKELNNSLKSQLEAAQNEIVSINEKLKQKDIELAVLRQTLQNSNKELLNMNQNLSKDVASVTKDEQTATEDEEMINKDEEKSEIKELCGNKEKSKKNDESVQNDLRVFSCNISLEKEACLIGLISAFLLVHPLGANIDDICSYLRPVYSTIKPIDVESLMKKFPAVYKEELSSVESSLKKTWFFTGFQM